MKVTVTNPASFVNDASAVSQVTANNAALTAAIENTLSRDGTGPNQMQAPLDMNSQRIINLPAPLSNNDAARFVDVGNGPIAAAAALADRLLADADVVSTHADVALTHADVLSTHADVVSANASAAAAATTLANALVKSNNLSDLTNVAAAKTNLSLVKADVGLGNIDNVSDVNKPVSTAQAAADATVAANAASATALKANIASPTFTGVPAAATATVGTNTTQLATTAFVLANGVAAGVSSIAGNSGAFTLASGLTNATNVLKVDASVLRGYLAGLTLSTAGASATFGISVGTAVDGTSTDFMKLASAYTKTVSPWVVGNGNGALDTAGITATWYHVYLIKRPDTGVVDVCISLSAAAPTFGSNIPVAYTLFRRIGSMLVNGSAQWTAFSQFGDEFLWKSVVNIVNNATAPTAATLLSLAAATPTGVQVTARFRGLGSGSASNALLFQSPDETSALANATNGNLDITWAASGQGGGNFLIRTDTSAQIRWSAILSGSVNAVSVFGWIDTRGKLN